MSEKQAAEKEAVGEPRTWRYGPLAGGKATVVASSVEFTPTHVVWRDREGAVVLAERVEQVNALTEVDNLGSSTRGTRG